MAHDLVIRGGTLYDGTGKPGETGDLAIDGDRITQVGGRADKGKRTDGIQRRIEPLDPLQHGFENLDR